MAAKGYAARTSSSAWWSTGDRNRVAQLLIVSAYWALFQIEGGSPGTTAILLSVAVCLVEGPGKKRHATQKPVKALPSGERSLAPQDRQGTVSVKLSANEVAVGQLTPCVGVSADGVDRGTPSAAAPMGVGGEDPSPSATVAAVTLSAPCTPSSNAEEDPFEGSITRLAGAVELGTEPLIYVRRSDVEEIVDALVDIARTPGAPAVTSPALARLSLVRRSRRRDWTSGKGRRTCSPIPRSSLPGEERVSSTFRRLGSPAFRSTGRGVGSGGGSARREASASPASRASPAAGVSRGRALFHDVAGSGVAARHGVTMPGGSSSSLSASKMTPRARSPAGSQSAEGGATRRVRAAQDGKQRRLRRRVCSPSVSASASASASTSASSSPPGAAGSAGAAAVAVTAAATAATATEAAPPSELTAATTPVASVSKEDSQTSPAAGGLTDVTSGGGGDNSRDLVSPVKKVETPPIETPSISANALRENKKVSPGVAASEQKIRCAPVIQRASGKGEGSDFDDIWSSGWG